MPVSKKMGQEYVEKLPGSKPDAEGHAGFGLLERETNGEVSEEHGALCPSAIRWSRGFGGRCVTYSVGMPTPRKYSKVES